MSSTLARLPGLRAVEALKITSCIDSPRSSEARDSPSTQRTASMMLDLPQPFGPTTPTSWPGTWKWVGSTKDLKPASFIEVRRTAISLIERNSGERAGGPLCRDACGAGGIYKRRSQKLGGGGGTVESQRRGAT